MRTLIYLWNEPVVALPRGPLLVFDNSFANDGPLPPELSVGHGRKMPTFGGHHGKEGCPNWRLGRGTVVNIGRVSIDFFAA